MEERVLVTKYFGTIFSVLYMDNKWGLASPTRSPGK